MVIWWRALPLIRVHPLSRFRRRYADRKRRNYLPHRDVFIPTVSRTSPEQTSVRNIPASFVCTVCTALMPPCLNSHPLIKNSESYPSENGRISDNAAVSREITRTSAMFWWIRNYKTKMASVSLCCKIHFFKAENIKLLSAFSTHRHVYLSQRPVT